MEEKSLFIKLDKHKEVNDLIQKIEETKNQTKQKIDLMNEIILKEKRILDKFEESLKKMDSHLDEANSLLNSEWDEVLKFGVLLSNKRAERV